jgi:hypothetical protein
LFLERISKQCSGVRRLPNSQTRNIRYRDYFGELGTIRWFCDYADLAALEKVGNQLLADQEYLQKVSKGVELIIPGSFFDTVMRAI